MMLGAGLVTGCLSLGCMARGKFPGLSDWWTCLSFRPSFSLPTFSYIGDCEISAELQKIQAGVNGIQVCGTWWHCPPPMPLLPALWAGGSRLTLEQVAGKGRTPHRG